MKPDHKVVLAEYFTAEDKTLLFIGRADFESPLVKEILISQSEIREFVKTYLSAPLHDESKGRWTVSRRFIDFPEELFHKAFSPLIEPLLAPLSDGNNTPLLSPGDLLWIVPHDFLHYLPLHALKVRSQTLIERNPVCYTPSASVMKYCQMKRKASRDQAIIFGDSCQDLIHARAEAQIVAQQFKTQPYLQQQASKSNLMSLLKASTDSLGVLHFACHGQFDASTALESSILLAQPEASSPSSLAISPDPLTAEAIFGMDLPVNLVTLSACESGINENRPGDELIGLTRALIFAGAPSVMVSLWAVEDLSTSLLMEIFYDKFLTKDADDSRSYRWTKAEALQIAQCYVKGLTAQDVVSYCESAITSMTWPQDSDTILRFKLTSSDFGALPANDWSAALSIYRTIQNDLKKLPDSETNQQLSRKIEKAITKLQFKVAYATNASESVKYDQVYPFSHIFYWAPFILVGDWQ